MKVRLLRQGLEGKRNAVVDVTERRAEQLIRHKPPLAVPLGEKEGAPSNKMMKDGAPSNKAVTSPLAESSPDGGRDGTGKSKPWSSSQADPAPERSTSAASKGKSKSK